MPWGLPAIIHRGAAISQENVAFPYGLETSRDLHNKVV
jgi:hypothetical protein